MLKIHIRSRISRPKCINLIRFSLLPFLCLGTLLISFFNISQYSFLIKDVSKATEASAASKIIHTEQTYYHTSSSPKANTIIPITNFNPYPEFDRDCPSYPKHLPPNIKDVKLFYHVGMVNNWKEIVHDQLVTLEKCGLAYYASSLTITYANGDEKSLWEVLKEHEYFAKNSTNMEIRLIPGPSMAPWESESINAIHDACHNTFGSLESEINSKVETREDTLVFYFHNKGSSKYDPDWRNQMSIEASYSRSLYWRKYLEYFLLERPNLCIYPLANGANTCGPQYKALLGPHYSGNFWSASCKFIVKNKDKMTKIDYTMKERTEFFYTDAEFWLAKGCENEESFPDCIGLSNVNSNLYRKLIHPFSYEIENEEVALLQASTIMSTNIHGKILDNILEWVR